MPPETNELIEEYHLYLTYIQLCAGVLLILVAARFTALKFQAYRDEKAWLQLDPHKTN